MLYPKNVPNWERIARFAVSLVLVVIALSDQILFGNPSVIRVVVLIGSAVFLVVTAFVGWCPACAMVGRKLKKKSQEA
jgi:hypothetical protein